MRKKLKPKYRVVMNDIKINNISFTGTNLFLQRAASLASTGRAKNIRVPFAFVQYTQLFP